MVGLLDALGMAAASVGGWSDGAAIALHLALYHPQRVRALVLTPVDLSAEALTAEFWQQAAHWPVPEKLVTWWRTRISPTIAELQSIRAPTLIVAGEGEQFIQHAHFTQWQHVLPNAELVWIPAADHALVLTHPDAVNQAILSFLRKHQ